MKNNTNIANYDSPCKNANIINIGPMISMSNILKLSNEEQ